MATETTEEKTTETENTGLPFATIEIPTEHLGDEVLFEGDFKQVKIDVYWDSHGRKVYDDEEWTPQVLKDKHVKIINHKRMCYGDRWDLWELQIDGKKWGSIEGYRALKRVIHIDAPAGHG